MENKMVSAKNRPYTASATAKRFSSTNKSTAECPAVYHVSLLLQERVITWSGFPIP